MVPTGPKYSIHLLFGARLKLLPLLAWRGDGTVSEALHCCLVMQIGGFWLFHHCLDFGTLEKVTLNLDCNEDKSQ